MADEENGNSTETVEVNVTEAPPPEYSPASAHAEIMGALGSISSVANSAYEEAKRAREIAEEARATANRVESDNDSASEAEAMAEIAVDAAIAATDAATDAAQAAEEAEEATEEGEGNGDAIEVVEDTAPVEESAPADTPPGKPHWMFRSWGRR